MKKNSKHTSSSKKIFLFASLIHIVQRIFRMNLLVRLTLTFHFRLIDKSLNVDCKYIFERSNFPTIGVWVANFLWPQSSTMDCIDGNGNNTYWLNTYYTILSIILVMSKPFIKHTILLNINSITVYSSSSYTTKIHIYSI